MRGIVFLIIALFAVCAWIASENAVREQEQVLISATNADYQRCVTIRNGPLKPPRRRLNGAAPISEIS